jgi:hypothetical protein
METPMTTTETAPGLREGLTAAMAIREGAVYDSYVGLRTLGYTVIGALRALRVLGLSLAEAKAAADRYGDFGGGK